MHGTAERVNILCNINPEANNLRVLNDWTLLEKLKQGDEAAFKKIVETWKDMVYNTAIGIVQSAEDAEDVAQEVFVQVYQSIHSFKGESKLSTWLYRGGPKQQSGTLSGSAFGH